MRTTWQACFIGNFGLALVFSEPVRCGTDIPALRRSARHWDASRGRLFCGRTSGIRRCERAAPVWELGAAAGIGLLCPKNSHPKGLHFFSFSERLSIRDSARSLKLLSRIKPSASAWRESPACSKLAIAGSYKELADLRPTIDTVPL